MRKEIVYQQILNIDPYKKRPKNMMALGVLFAEVYKNYCRFNRNANKWYFYNDKTWELDLGNCNVMKCLKEFARLMKKYVYQLEECTEEYGELIGKLAGYYHRDNMLKDCKPHHYFDNEQIDNVKFFNCQNGTFDLDTLTFNEQHEPNDLLTKISNVYYDKHATSKDWTDFIFQVMQGNQGKIDYLQKTLGLALTGDTNLETCWILYGATTRNGKSTLVDTISHMLGKDKGYAMNMDPETLAIKNKGAVRSDLARLQGCRFLTASEPPKKMIFDISLLKTMLGRDTITARKLYENEIEFVPIFKLFINTNYLPHVNDMTVFSSGRINVITFDQHFRKDGTEGIDKLDPTLKDKLKSKENISGIFNWCLDGLKKYRVEGLESPDCIKEATAEYQDQSDKIKNFIEDCLEETKGNNIKAKDVYSQFKEWCENNGYGVENRNNFYIELRAKDLLAKTGTVNGKTEKNVIKDYKLKIDTFFSGGEDEYE